MKIYIRKHKYSKNNTKNNNKKTNQTNQQKGFNMKNENFYLFQTIHKVLLGLYLYRPYIGTMKLGWAPNNIT